MVNLQPKLAVFAFECVGQLDEECGDYQLDALWERGVLIVRDFVSRLVCYDQLQWYYRKCVR